MMEIENDFEQLSPLMDDIMQHVSRLHRSALHKAALSSLLLTHASIAARKEMLAALHSREPAGDPAESIMIASLLSDKTEEAARLLRDAERELETASRVQ